MLVEALKVFFLGCAGIIVLVVGLAIGVAWLADRWGSS